MFMSIYLLHVPMPFVPVLALPPGAARSGMFSMAAMVSANSNLQEHSLQCLPALCEF
jgi:hypothetical protein